MNKKKLVELAEEVLTDIDADLETEFRNHLEKELCNKLGRKFDHASSYLYGNKNPKIKKSYKESYEAVKPILDDTIDKLLNNKNL